MTAFDVVQFVEDEEGNTVEQYLGRTRISSRTNMRVRLEELATKHWGPRLCTVSSPFETLGPSHSWEIKRDSNVFGWKAVNRRGDVIIVK